MKKIKNSRNPILPLEVHIPDSEAHIMPDGKLYIYGSYDGYADAYCSESYYVASTEDMENWTVYDEALNGKDIPWFGDDKAPKYPGFNQSEPTPFMRKMKEETPEDDINFVLENVDEKKPLLFAPDCISKDGKYYLYFCMADDSEGVAVSDKPQGPFSNPVQLPCGGIDPAIFIDDDGQAYYYWGQFRSHGVKLHPDMASFDAEAVVDNLLTEEEHFFHEGSSVRKIGDTYYCVYADMERGRPTALGYATGTSPLGPFQYRGIIIDNCDCDPSSWNNHGSIECVNGQWYVFYHRSSRNSKIFRRLCIEPITIRPDGTIKEVVMTSQGPGKPFGPGECIMGYQACGLKGKLYIDKEDYGEYRGKEKLTNISEGDEAIFRYVESENGFGQITVEAAGTGKIEVYMSGKSAGIVEIRNGRQINNEIWVDAGSYELTFKFKEAHELEIYSFVLNS